MSIENPTRWFDPNWPCHKSMRRNLWPICRHQEHFRSRYMARRTIYFDRHDFELKQSARRVSSNRWTWCYARWWSWYWYVSKNFRKSSCCNFCCSSQGRFRVIQKRELFVRNDSLLMSAIKSPKRCKAQCIIGRYFVENQHGNSRCKMSK